MNRYYLIVLFVLSLSGIKSFAQCVDATAVPSVTYPMVGQEVNVLYFGDIVFESDWDFSVDFGNGTSNTGYGIPAFDILGTVTYSTAGVYLVTVTVADSNEVCFDTHSFYIEVSAVTGNCEASSMTPSIHNMCLKDTVSLTVTLDAGIDNISFSLDHIEWDLGDGNTIITTTSTLDYHYTYGGIYYVRAKVVAEDLSDGSLCERYALTTYPGPLSTFDYYDYCEVRVYDAQPYFSMSPASPVELDDVTFTYTGFPFTIPPAYTNYWDYQFFFDGGLKASGTGLVTGTNIFTENDIDLGLHTAKLVMVWKDGVEICPQFYEISFVVEEEPCDTCNSFKPVPGKSYWISAWVQEEPDTPGEQVTGYDDVSVTLDYVSTSGTTTSPPLYPTGEIIDGWQRIAGEFTIPSGTLDLQVNFNAGANVTYFDDIRIHPFNGSMKSYVYDGETFWLVAELDDNNYATIYEYDAEGGLVRIKKETSGGIVTIQETRSNTVKIEP